MEEEEEEIRGEWDNMFVMTPTSQSVNGTPSEEIKLSDKLTVTMTPSPAIIKTNRELPVVLQDGSSSDNCKICNDFSHNPPRDTTPAPVPVPPPAASTTPVPGEHQQHQPGSGGPKDPQLMMEDYKKWRMEQKVKENKRLQQAAVREALSELGYTHEPPPPK